MSSAVSIKARPDTCCRFGTPKLFVLVSFDESAEPEAIGPAYMQSPELAHDLEGFDHLMHIVHVDAVELVPTPGSPLA